MTYVTAAEVIEYTGRKPADFALPDSGALTDLLDRWAAHVKDMIDRDRSRDFLDEAEGVLDDVPGTVRSVALRAMGNYVRLAINMRESGLIRLDEWRVGVDASDQVLTRDLRRELAASFGTKGRIRGFVTHGAGV